jgi:hypothetical protein
MQYYGCIVCVLRGVLYFGLVYLTPRGLRVLFPKNTPNRPFLAQEALLNSFSFFCTLNRRILY